MLVDCRVRWFLLNHKSTPIETFNIYIKVEKNTQNNTSLAAGNTATISQMSMGNKMVVKTVFIQAFRQKLLKQKEKWR